MTNNTDLATDDGGGGCGDDIHDGELIGAGPINTVDEIVVSHNNIDDMNTVILSKAKTYSFELQKDELSGKLVAMSVFAYV